MQHFTRLPTASQCGSSRRAGLCIFSGTRTPAWTPALGFASQLATAITPLFTPARSVCSSQSGLAAVSGHERRLASLCQQWTSSDTPSIKWTSGGRDAPLHDYPECRGRGATLQSLQLALESHPRLLLLMCTRPSHQCRVRPSSQLCRQQLI